MHLFVYIISICSSFGMCEEKFIVLWSVPMRSESNIFHMILMYGFQNNRKGFLGFTPWLRQSLPQAQCQCTPFSKIKYTSVWPPVMMLFWSAEIDG